MSADAVDGERSRSGEAIVARFFLCFLCWGEEERVERGAAGEEEEEQKKKEKKEKKGGRAMCQSLSKRKLGAKQESKGEKGNGKKKIE